MLAKHRHLVGYNLRQALFKAAGLSEYEKFGGKAFVWQVRNDYFIVRRSHSSVEPTPHPKARLICIFECGHMAHSWFPRKSERLLWPAYPWRDADVEKEKRLARCR